MNIVRQICKTRKSVCPRTSYASGGTGATNLIVFHGNNAEDIQTEWTRVIQGLIKQKEFDVTESLQSIEELNSFNWMGHVMCIVGNVDKEVLPSFLSLIDGHRSSLIFLLRKMRDEDTEDDSDGDDDSDDSDGEVRRRRKKEQTRIQKSKVIYDSLGLTLEIWQIRVLRMNQSSMAVIAAASSSAASDTAKAFNGQPGVWTKQQFRYLWGLLDGFKPTNETERIELEEGRLRVLQRIASKPLIDGTTWTMAQWEEEIRKALVEKNAHDYGIYDLIRAKTLGKRLLESLRETATDPKRSASIASGSGGMGGTDDADEGRSEHLVDATMECIPLAMRENPRHFVKCLLDYGCAEGAITANLGKRLQLSPDKILGADVRAINSREFTYVQLAAEDPDAPPSTPGSILPTVKDKSVSVINCAMVFHHVIHTEAIIKELRRVIDSTEGLVIIREHDCRNAPTAAFLDILHGLFSLAWKDPVEWPNFIAEYRAYYRSREEWTSLFQSCGFRLHTTLPSSYTAAEASVLRNGGFKNVTRAYYAVYIPDWTAEVTRPTTLSGRKRARPETDASSIPQISPSVFIDIPKPISIPAAVASTTHHVDTFDPKKCTPAQIIARAATLARKEYQVVESKSHPGQFYKYYPANGRVEWIHIL